MKRGHNRKEHPKEKQKKKKKKKRFLKKNWFPKLQRRKKRDEIGQTNAS